MIFDINTNYLSSIKLLEIFEYINNPPEYLIKMAIKHNSYNIQFLKDKEKWIFHIIKENPYAIKDFKNPSKEAQLYALSFIDESNYNIFICKYINNPCKEVVFQDTLYCLKLKVWNKMGNVKLIRSRKKLVLE